MNETKAIGYTDADRSQFLKKLDGSDACRLTDWELKFLESTIDHVTFTPKQCEAINQMIFKYGDILKW